MLAGEPGGTPGISLDLYQRNIQRFGLDRGTVEDTGDGVRVRFERQLMMVPVDRVWSALTGADVPVPGKPVPAGFTVPEFEAGPVTEVAAPDLLEYEWLAGRVRWELSTGPGGARVLLSQTVPSRSAEAALSVWRERIEALAEELTHPS